MGNAEKTAVKRLGRGIFSLIISAVTAYLTDKPELLVGVPILNALGKWLRTKYTLKNIPF